MHAPKVAAFGGIPYHDRVIGISGLALHISDFVVETFVSGE